MARLVTNGFELGNRGDGNGIDLRFWDADETVRNSGNMYTKTDIVRVNGRSMKIDPGSKTHYITHFLSGTPTEVWLRLAVRRHSTTANSSTNPFVHLIIPGGDDVYIKMHGTTRCMSIWQGGNSLALEASNSMLDQTWHLMELHFKADAVNGRLELRNDGQKVLEYDGNTGTAGATALRVGIMVTSGWWPFNPWWFDDVALNDNSGTRNNSWVGDGHIVYLKPNGDGEHSELTGSDGNQVNNYQLVDDVPVDEADYVEGLSVPLRDSYSLISSLSAVIPPGATIKHVDVVAVAKTMAAGTDALEGFVRVAAADYYCAVKENLPSDWAVQRFDFDLNPATAAAWTTAELDGVEAGVRTAVV